MSCLFASAVILSATGKQLLKIRVLKEFLYKLYKPEATALGLLYNKINMDEIPKYILRKSKRAKRVRLSVYCDGSVVATSPLGVSRSIIDKFVFEKRQWLANKIKFYNNIDEREVRVFSVDDYLRHRGEALALVKERVEFYNKIYKYSFNRISVKNQKTRWGSCSRKRNLNFNYKVLFLPEKLRDYIIVHELCHLKELNHSQRFWSLVGEVLPGYLNIRRELRKHELFYR